ncbi:MAG: LPS export ABC transporter permease LptG [Thermodesulfobacteriota bacterium]
MKIVIRYLLDEFVRVLIITLSFLVLVFLIVDFLEKVDNFLKAGLPWSRIAGFYFYMTPTMLFYMAPVAILVSILISMGLLARRGEIVALKAGGLSLFRLSAPIALAALFIGVLIFALSEKVIPGASTEANQIWNVEVEKRGDVQARVRREVWFRGPRDVIYFRVFDERTQKAEGVKIYAFDERFHLSRRIEAAAAVKTNGRWLLKDGLEKSFSNPQGIKVKHFHDELIDLPDLPEEFVQVERATEEMSSTELAAWINRMANEGYDPLRYEVDLQFKYSFPFICFIMAVIGLPIAFWKERGGGIALGIGVGIVLSFIYLVFLGLSRSLGYSGVLPPVVVAWLPNLIFTLFGFYLFTFVRQ